MDPITILSFIILFLLSGFFSGSELALMSLPSHKVDALLRSGKFGAKDLKYIKDRSDKLLITILIGNNLVNTFTAALATFIATDLAAKSGLEPATAVGIATGVITFLLLVFGEIAPKSFAIKNAEFIALFVAKIYRFLLFILAPLIFFLELIIRFLTGAQKVEEVSEQEIEAFIDMGKDSGTLEHKQHEHLKNVLEFGDITVEEIMTPRVKLDCLDSETTVAEALEYYLSHTHSRIPVYLETVDKIIGILTIRDVLSQKDRTKTLADLKLDAPMKIPLNQPIDNLLEEFQKQHKVMAVVLDEYGGVAGIVTLEDIIEEVFGDIKDETDKEGDYIVNKGTDIYEIDSSILFEDVLGMFGLEFTDFGWTQERFDGETVSYVITDFLERFPQKHEVLTFNFIENSSKLTELSQGLQLKVLDIHDGNIGRIEVRKV